MIVINSAAYVVSELVSEVGYLPPCFLPLRSRPLYQHQLESLGSIDEEIVLNLPAGFTVDEHDRRFLEKHKCRIVHTDPKLSLIEALRQVFSVVGEALGPIRLLHGDTLQSDYGEPNRDVISVGANAGFYPRAKVILTAEDQTFGGAIYGYCNPGDLVLTGYFAFSSRKAFLDALLSEGHFLDVVNKYYTGGREPDPLHRPRIWADCGHVNAYFQSRAFNTSERSFNKLNRVDSYIRKTSGKVVKLQAEEAWFSQLPRHLNAYTPQIGDSGHYEASEGVRYFYDIEYVFAMPLSDLYAFGRQSAGEWRQIFVLCSEFLDQCRKVRPEALDAGDWSKMYVNKTVERIAEFAQSSAWPLDVPVTVNGNQRGAFSQIVADAGAIIEHHSSVTLSLYHGDFCFSNILYDARAKRIKVIDPRGLDQDERISNIGDVLYDCGKLFHSVLGHYDLVIAGIIAGERVGPSEIRTHGTVPERISAIVDAYRSVFFSPEQIRAGAPSERVVAAVASLLFLSMLPLHADAPGRQYAFIARAMELHHHYNMMEC